MNVYFIAGIGADYRQFKHIELPIGFEARYIHAVKEINTETITEYASRLIDQIDLSNPFMLIGLSMGGIIAMEISKLTQCKFVILISSIPFASDLPPYYRIVYKYKIHRLFPSFLWKISALVKNAITIRGWSNKKLVSRIVMDGSNSFIRWGINAVLEWENEIRPITFYHIHGSSDEVFPIKYTHPTHQLKGGHMLIMNQHSEINEILRSICEHEKYPAV